MSIRGQVLRSNVDMTQGRPLNVIFSFALPLLMGNLFNQLYNVVDTGCGIGKQCTGHLHGAEYGKTRYRLRVPGPA